MKTTIILLSLVCSSTLTFAQSFVLPIYLLDGLGNMDTVYVSGDLTASTNLDTNFGEVNLNGIPYDSTFEARLTYDVFSATRIETKKQALYYECSAILPAMYFQQNPVLIRCKNWPLVIKWDRDLVDSIPLCIQYSGISNDLGYFGGNNPQSYLNSKDSVIYSQANLQTYYNSGTNSGQSAPIYVLAIGIVGDGTVGFEAIPSSTFSIYPNPATTQLTINLDGLPVDQVSIYNANGALVNKVKQPTDNRLDVNNLPIGVYIAVIKVGDTVHRFRWVKM
jgi:hypothetical protein